MPDLVQRTLALIGAILSAPLVGALGLLVRLESPGGSLHLATRIGRGGDAFRLLKLRTMRAGAAVEGPGISVTADPRVTRVGRLLRSARLDELPQLWNVVRGDMLLVGPRPEDPRYLDLDDPLVREVLTSKPGITGVTQLIYARETELLPAGDPEPYYRDAILPAKLRLDAGYLRHRSSRLDLWILWQTVLTVAGRPPARAAIDRRCPPIEDIETRT